MYNTYDAWEAYQEDVYDQLLDKWLGLEKDPKKAENKATEEFNKLMNQYD